VELTWWALDTWFWFLERLLWGVIGVCFVLAIVAGIVGSDERH
jgi:hypothetical protein